MTPSLPNNPGAERAVLGAAIFYPEIRPEVLELDRDCFTDQRRKVFDLLDADITENVLVQRLVESDVVSGADVLSKRTEAQGLAYELIETVSTSDATRRDMSLLRELLAGRRVGEQAAELDNIASNGFDSDALARIIEKLQTVAQGATEVPADAQSIDVCELAALEAATPDPFVIRDLQRHKDILVVAGEEGDGKTTLVEQVCRQMLRGEKICGLFEVGEFGPEKILFVDTHQEEPEARSRASEFERRGLGLKPEQMFWWRPEQALNLGARAGDRRIVEAEIARRGARYLWLDAASHLVDDVNDDREVGALFDFLSVVMRTHDLVGVGMTLFPRKRAQGEYGRRFDDLFGSREWKGRPSKVVYIETNRIVAWKDRGSHLARLWPERGGRYPRAALDRPGLNDPDVVPFVITADAPDAIDAEALAAKAVGIVTAAPDEYTKTSLAHLLGGRKETGLVVVERLLAAGTLGPRKERAKLHVTNVPETPQTGLES